MQYWDMGFGPGNFSYAALNASRAKATGTPYQRDTSVAYAGPGASYNSSVIADDAPGGWRLFRIKVSDPCVPSCERMGEIFDAQRRMVGALSYHPSSNYGHAGPLHVCRKSLYNSCNLI